MKTLCLTLCSVAFSAFSASAVTIINGDFETDTAFTNTGATHVNQFGHLDPIGTWVTKEGAGLWTRSASDGNPGAAAFFLDGAFSNRALLQSVADNKASTGKYELNFDLLLIDKGDELVDFNVFVYGVADAASSYNVSALFGTQNSGVTLLKSANFTTNTIGFESQSIAAIDLSTGYDRLILAMHVVGVKASEEDAFGIDNISFSSIPEPANLALFMGIGFACFTCSRRSRA